ncbi:MAG: hypothetical protein V4577_30330, partial [Bacteroidota bacterium]
SSKKIKFCPEAILHYRSGNPGSLSAQLSMRHAWSAYRSVTLSTGYLLHAENSDQTRLLCANSLQQLIYSLYPDFPAICRHLERQISALGGSHNPWQASYKSKLIAKVIGWKATKRILRWLR